MDLPLFIAHVNHPRPGWLEDWALRRFGGHVLVRAHAQPLPDPDTLVAPVIVFGGPMGVSDAPALPWLAAERDFLARLLARDHPVLGICLGAQLMASALGHAVAPHPQGEIECGYHQLFSAHGLPEWVYHWHRDGIFLDASLAGCPSPLAVSAWCQGRATQAFARGRALGVQFHPEITAATIASWLARDRGDLALPGARPAISHLPDHARHGPAVAAWLSRTLERRWSLPPLDRSLPGPMPPSEAGLVAG